MLVHVGYCLHVCKGVGFRLLFGMISTDAASLPCVAESGPCPTSQCPPPPPLAPQYLEKFIQFVSASLLHVTHWLQLESAVAALGAWVMSRRWTCRCHHMAMITAYISNNGDGVNDKNT